MKKCYLSGVVCLVAAGAVNHIYIDNIWFYVLEIITCIISAVAGIYCTVKESQRVLPWWSVHHVWLIYMIKRNRQCGNSLMI